MAPRRKSDFFSAFQDDPWNERVMADIAVDSFGIPLQATSPRDAFSFADGAIAAIRGQRHEPTTTSPLRGAFRWAARRGPLRGQRVAIQSDYLTPMGRLRLDVGLRQLPQSRAVPEFAAGEYDPTTRL